MPKPYDLNLHKSYNVNNNDKNYKSFTDANGEQWYTDKPLTTYNNNKLAYVTNGRHSKWVTVGNEFSTQPQMLQREQAVKQDINKPRIQAANDLTSGLTDLITGGMAGSLREGAQNLTKGNYIKGISQLATPAMFGSGVAGNIARAGIGSYNLLNEDGVRKTYKYINNGDYGNAAVSGLGDILNGSMAIHGGTQLFRNSNIGRNFIISNKINSNLNNFKPEQLSPTYRIKVGDLEVNHPNMYYRQGKGVIEDAQKSGIIRISYDGKPQTPKPGKITLFRKQFGNPMFAQGDLWYGIGNNGDVLATTKPMQYAEKTSMPLKPDASLAQIRSIGSRRIPYGTLKTDEVTMYRWDPNYGYRQIKKEPTSISFYTKNLSENINSNKRIPYYSQFEQQEAQQRMVSDIKRGYQNFKDWMTNPHYLESTLDNIEEAKRMGLKYTPTYDKPQYKALMQNGIKINFKKQMHGMGATSQFGAQAGHPTEVDLNLGSPQSFFNTVRHESGHAAYHGNGLTPDELKYLRFKTHQAFIDNAEAGPYDFHQQTGEAAMNGRDLGSDLGISVGQSYPGYQKALETLNSGLGKSTKDGMIKLFKTDEQSMPYVWKLLNGTLLGGALMTKINTNK